MTSASRESAEKRISGYKRQSGQGNNSPVDYGDDPYADPDYDSSMSYPKGPRGDRLTGPQRRRAIHKSGGARPGPVTPGWTPDPNPDRANLTDADRWLSAGKGRHTYLNPKQFSTMSQIMDMTPSDGAYDVRHLIGKKNDEIDRGIGDTGAGYPDLREAMRRGGPAGGKVPPILLSPTGFGGQRIGNGGHRIALADELGWKAMPVTDDRAVSGYGDMRFYDPQGEDDSDYDGSPNSYASSQPQLTSDYTSEESGQKSSGVGRWAPGARSHVPGVIHGGAPYAGQYGEQNRGQPPWHGGRDKFGATKTHGLYTELHGPAPEALSGKQFGPPPPNHPGKMAGGQPALPGMNVTRNVGRSAFDRNPPNGPRGGVWTGGNATGGKAMRMRADLAKLGPAIARGDFKGAQTVQTSAKHGRWPGGGKILTGDL